MDVGGMCRRVGEVAPRVAAKGVTRDDWHGEAGLGRFARHSPSERAPSHTARHRARPVLLALANTLAEIPGHQPSPFPIRSTCATTRGTHDPRPATAHHLHGIAACSASALAAPDHAAVATVRRRDASPPPQAPGGSHPSRMGSPAAGSARAPMLALPPHRDAQGRRPHLAGLARRQPFGGKGEIGR